MDAAVAEKFAGKTKLAATIVSLGGVFFAVEGGGAGEKGFGGLELGPLYAEVPRGGFKKGFFPGRTIAGGGGLNRALNEKAGFIAFLGCASDFFAAGENVEFFSADEAAAKHGFIAAFRKLSLNFERFE